MDWSAIYEETGDEDGDWTGFSSRLTPMLQKFSSRGEYTSKVCYIFTVNYVLGVGCLGIPYAFLRSGILLGTILIISLSIVAYMTVMWVAEAGYRDMVIRKMEANLTPTKRGHNRPRRRTLSNATITPEGKLFSQGGHNDSRSSTPTSGTTSFLSRFSDHENSSRGVSRDYGSCSMSSSIQEDAEFLSLSNLIEKEVQKERTPSPFSPQAGIHQRMHLTSEEYHTMDSRDGEAEVVELVLEFLGPHAKSCYQLSVMLLMSIGLIAYTQVFVRTFVEQIWHSVPDYVPTFLFAVVVIPLSCVDLAEQIDIQVVMAILRFISLATLLIGTFFAMCFDAHDSGYGEAGDMNVAVTEEHVPIFDTTGFSLMFTTAIFSQLFQHSVPGLIRPLPQNEKKDIPRIFMAALCTTGFFYLVIGSSCVYYFGPRVNQAINLNFVNFYWGLDNSSWMMRLLVQSLSMIVVLFPALDTLSVYPLIANTLGNNLHASFPHAWKSVYTFLNDFDRLARSRCEAKKLTTQSWRLFAAFPPILLSFFITDLSLTLQFAGLCGIVVALITPSLLQYYSIQQLEEVKLNFVSKETKGSDTEHEDNPYVGFFSDIHCTYSIVVVAIFAFLICSYQIYTVA